MAFLWTYHGLAGRSIDAYSYNTIYGRLLLNAQSQSLAMRTHFYQHAQRQYPIAVRRVHDHHLSCPTNRD